MYGHERSAMLFGQPIKQSVTHLRLLKLVLFSLPFNLMIVPGLPLNVPVSLFVIFFTVCILLVSTKRIVWVGVEEPLIMFTAFAAFSICLALVTTPEGTFHVLPESYGMRGSRFRGFYQICIMLSWYATAWVVVNACSTKSTLFDVLRFWLLFVIGCNFFGFYEVLADRYGLPMYYPATFDVSFTRAHVLGLQRSYSVFGEPTTYASFLVMNLALVWGLRTHLLEEAKSYRLPLNTVFITSCIALYLTASAAGFASFSVLMCAMAVSTMRKSHGSASTARFLMVACVSLVAIVSLSGLGEVLYEEKFSRAKFLAAQETEMIKSDARTRGLMLGVEGFEANPIFGVGFGNEPFYTYMPEVNELAFGTYNMVVSRLLEGGIVGTALFGLLIGTMFFPRSAAPHNSGTRIANASLVSALRWGLAGSLVFQLWFGPSYLTGIDWLSVGLISVATRLSPMDDEPSGTLST